MSKPITTFIVGAGAGVDLNFPTGDGLKQRIRSLIDPRNFQYINADATVAALFDAYRVLSLGEDAAFHDYGVAAARLTPGLDASGSIDDLLRARARDQRVVQVGKLAIVSEILKAERNSPLSQVDTFGNINYAGDRSIWHHTLADGLLPTIDPEQPENPFAHVRFIIFNYDRCIERFLHDSITRYLDVASSYAADLLSTVRFIHPYGVVGNLPWQRGSVPEAQFGEQPSGEKLVAIARNLKTFSEALDPDSNVPTLLRDALESSDIIVFLGFGYLRQNMELLSVVRQRRARRIFGTAYDVGIGDHDALFDSLIEHYNRFQARGRRSGCKGWTAEIFC